MPPGPEVSVWAARNLNKKPLWKTFKEWYDVYGPMVSFFLGGKPVIVLNTAETSWDLLEKRGDIYSSRPRNITADQLLSGGMRGIGMPYGQSWRKWRTLQQSSLNLQASVRHRPLQTLETSVLLKDLLNAEEGQHSQHLSRYAISVTFSVAYGRRITSLSDEFVLANQKIEKGKPTFDYSQNQVDIAFPFLLCLPRPLQWFRHEIDREKAFADRVYMDALRAVQQQIAQGTAQHSMATHALQKQDEFGLNDMEIAYALSAPWSAGVATTVGTLEIAILAILYNKNTMLECQAEIDRVVGRERLPGFSDVDRLPYLRAFIKEVMRWKPLVRTGFPHSVIEDDVYNGMFIPKGSTVWANIAAMMSDPTLFPDPDLFKPERFLENNLDPRLVNFNLPFGFGRRICPGLHIAQQSVFIVLARLLWAFDVLPIIGTDGKPDIQSLDDSDFTASLVCRPTNLRYKVSPRNHGVRELISLEAERAEAELSAWASDVGTIYS
ncbi:cytochrome P450 [Marasmius fiardii PR-910]|nr:cytochrome P450 [Marasmius fiardii PR-910]